MSGSVIKFFEGNNEESNTKIIFHALQQKPHVAVYSKVTDVLVLMVFVNKFNEK